MKEVIEDLARKAGWIIEPAKTGEPTERRRLAAALRALAERCVLADVDDAQFSPIADSVERNVQSLAAQPTHTPLDAVMDGSNVMNAILFADRSALIGRSNAIAPPMELSVEGEVAVGTVTFGPVYEGAPGWVHGGFVAAAIDQVMGFGQVIRGVASVTGLLTVRYLRPTPIGKRLRIESRFASAEGRENKLKSRMFDGDRLLAEADALFIAIDPEEFAAKLRRGAGGYK